MPVEELLARYKKVGFASGYFSGGSYCAMILKFYFQHLFNRDLTTKKLQMMNPMMHLLYQTISWILQLMKALNLSSRPLIWMKM